MVARLLSIGAVGLVSGILVRSFFIFSWHLALFVLVLSCVCVGMFGVYRVRTYLYYSLFLVAVVLGMARMAVVPQELPFEFSAFMGNSVSFEGVVIAHPDVRETSQRLQVRVVHEGVATTVLVVAPLYPTVEYGSLVTVDGPLAKPEPFDTLEGRSFNYPRFLAKNGIFSVIKNGAVEVQGKEQSVQAVSMRALYGMRHTFEKGVSQALPEPASALALGLVVGGKQGLGKGLLEAFTIAGLLPIIVLSGYNVMIVAEAILRGSRFMPKRIAVGTAIIAIVLFVLAAGSGSSAVRAGIMACVGLFARATHRTYDALRILAAVFVLMLVHNPLLLVSDPGFQFSFAATLGLIIGSPLAAARLPWIKSEFLRETIATTIAAQVFVTPLLLYQIGNLSLVAIPANILVLPLVPFTMLFSFIAGAVGIFFPVIAPLVGLPAYALLSYIMYVARLLAGLPFSSIIIPQFSFGIVILLYAGIAWWSIRLKRETPRKRSAGL